MYVTVQWCNDSNSYYYGYVFRHGTTIVARCDESEYHDTVRDLEEQGYILR